MPKNKGVKTCQSSKSCLILFHARTDIEMEGPVNEEAILCESYTRPQYIFVGMLAMSLAMVA